MNDFHISHAHTNSNLFSLSIEHTQRIEIFLKPWYFHNAQKSDKKKEAENATKSLKLIS